MPARAFPLSSKAMPASMPTSVKVPSRLLRKSWLGSVSLARAKSGHPSESWSTSATPSAFDVGLQTPASRVTSSKVPSPRLRRSVGLSPL